MRTYVIGMSTAIVLAVSVWAVVHPEWWASIPISIAIGCAVGWSVVKAGA